MILILVKCRICGKKKDKQWSYCVSKITKTGKVQNQYYCSKKEYDEHNANLNYKDNVYMIINDIFGYKIENTAIYKEINDIVKNCSYYKVFKYIQDNKEFLENTICGKSFNSEYAKIRYFSAIIKNNITDYNPEEEKEIVEIEEDIVDFKPTIKQKKKRRSISEIEEEI